MKKALNLRLCATLLLGLLASGLHAQQRTWKLTDAQTGSPVIFATIRTGAQSGTISNEEGAFNLDPGQAKTGIQISCMGYRTLTLTSQELENAPETLQMTPAAIALNEVRVGEAIPSAETVISRARARLEQNYALGTASFRVFYRQSEAMAFDRLDLELEKASDLNREALKAADARLRRLGQDLVKSQAREYLDLNGMLQIHADTLGALRISRATALVDHNRDYSPEQIQQRAQEIILDHLDTTQTYKVKTGIFKIEDSVSVADEFLEQEDASRDSSDFGMLRHSHKELLRLAGWQGNHLNRLLDADWYRYAFLGATYFDGNYVYAIAFSPRRHKAKFSGTLYVDAASYAVLKMDYAYAEGREGEKVNLKLLLGIKYAENLYRGTVIYRRNMEGKYAPYFIQREQGNYIYLHRGLKFIENSAAGRKVAFDFLMEGGVRTHQNLLVQPMESEAGNPFEGYTEPKQIYVRQLDRFAPSVWQDPEVMAPLEEMRQFRVEKP
ncbi:carboxypeptidase-like regulatory domain-containing protein [Robiginitalea sp. M366]|uniref:carboxypeptidase-like regulatory domain-containing protein n=1 Tax=Robiginitalea aestuariiviva TaxID=3036903 RepID=UPI00240D5B92|nr:carboxypeptidase-like regulatory domain-containing protein [Robiginitalea aestuariiviva]MDG1572999.1 carboxypeptidase-like regulatory domain-containing protein [Robiginitalea aestuariiviva]